MDGSFVTDKDMPSDVDLVLEFPDLRSFTQLRTIHGCLRNRKAIKQTYLVDRLERFTNQLGYGFRELFQELRPEDALRRGLPVGANKGILMIRLR